MAGFKKHLHSRKGHIAIITVFIALALFMVVATHYGTKTLSAVRAYVNAEGQWTKAQKEAVHLLVQYSIEQDPELYRQFHDDLELYKGFKTARQTLISDSTDYDLAFNGFQMGGLHPEDIELLIWLSRFSDNISYLEKAFRIWEEGNEHIAELDSIGNRLKGAVQAGRIDVEARNQFIQDIYAVDRALTNLENSFSATMGEGARWIRGIIFWSIVSMGMLLILTGYGITRSFFREINDLNEQLSESESKFKVVLQNSRDVIYQMDFESGNYEYMSPSVKNMLGYSPEQILAEGTDFILDRVHPEDLERMEQEVQEMKGKGIDEHFARETEFRIKTADGNYIWVSNQRSLVKDQNGDPVAIVGTVRDVSEQKKHEVEIEKSLKEKQTLLKEIHHRVKNNLAIISGLVELQKEGSVESVQAILDDVQSRIMAIAMVHEKLYQTETLSVVNTKEYVEDFSQMIAESFNTEQREITVKENIQSFSLDITKAVPLGLIFNELLNNAYKHGFTDSKSGKLRISLKKQNGKVILRVADNGKGLSDNFNLDDLQSLGVNLIKTLTKQLQGEVKTIPDDEWTEFQVEFPAT